MSEFLLVLVLSQNKFYHDALTQMQKAAQNAHVMTVLLQQHDTTPPLTGVLENYVVLDDLTTCASFTNRYCDSYEFPTISIFVTWHL